MSRLAFTFILFSIPAYLWFSSYQLVFSIPSPPLLVALAAFFCLLSLFVKKQIRFNHTASSLLLTALGLLFWSATVYFINGLYPQCLHRLLQIALGIAIAAITFLLASSYKRLCWLVYFLIFGGLVSAIVGLGQFFFDEPFIRLWLATGSVVTRGLSDVRAGRIAGLTGYSVPLSYQLGSITPFAIAILVFNKRKLSFGKRLVLMIIILVLLTALALTGIRSSLLGVFIGSVIVILLGFKQRRWGRSIIFVSIIVGLLLYSILGYVYMPGRFIELEDISAKSRFPMQITSIKYSIAHPLGTGIYNPSISNIPSFVRGKRITETVLNTTPHNQFLNVLVYYGFPGLFLLLAFYLFIYQSLRKQWEYIYKEEVNELKWICAGLMGAFTSYIINSMFHNAGPFVGDYFHWYFVGLLFVVGRIAMKTKLVKKSAPFQTE